MIVSWLSRLNNLIESAQHDINQANKNKALTQLYFVLKIFLRSFQVRLALDNVSLNIKRGEVHVLFGENGAGKSTLIQIIAGVHRQTSGKLFFNGKETELQSVQHARDLGISAVFQEFSIIPQLSVQENLFLGSEAVKGPFLDKNALRDQANETLKRLGFPLTAQ